MPSDMSVHGRQCAYQQVHVVNTSASIAKLQGVNSSFPPSWPLAEAQVSSVVPCCVQVDYTPLSIGTRDTLGLPASCAGGMPSPGSAATLCISNTGPRQRRIYQLPEGDHAGRCYVGIDPCLCKALQDIPGCVYLCPAFVCPKQGPFMPVLHLSLFPPFHLSIPPSVHVLHKSSSRE